MPPMQNIHCALSPKRFEPQDNMAHTKSTGHFASGAFLTAFLLSMAGASDAFAQDSVSTTPPELRDFRLDQPPPREPEPAPETTAPVAPIVVPPAQRPEAGPVESAPTQPVRQRQTPSPSSPPRAQQVEPASAKPVTSDAQSELPAPAPTPTVPMVNPAPDVASAPAETADNGNMLLIGGLIAFLLVGGGIFMWRRRKPRHHPAPAFRRTHADTGPALEPATPTPSILPEMADNPRPAPHAPQAKLQTKAESAAVAPLPLAVAFVPDTAVISFTSLVVRGQLQIANNSGQPISDLTLRAVLISASAEQQRAIGSFFANPGQIPPNGVGALEPGERIGLSLELSVALGEMQTFTVGDKTLLVPILLAHLSRDGDPLDAGAQLICMIGREANPPTAKMGPLRTDLGPRSFTGLGQRPLLT